MTDERFVFHEDVRERQKMKTGAYHKKGAKRTTNCKFPSDYLTKGQKMKLSGPVISIKMDLPYYSWKEFKKLPEELQAEYLSNLINKYGARKQDIADMFDISKATVYNACISYKNPIKFPRKGFADGKMDDRWLDFITKPGFEITPKVEKALVDIPVEESVTKEEVSTVKEDVIMEENNIAFKGVDRLSLSMNGTKQVIIGLLESVLGTNCDYTVKIDICKKDAIPGSMEISFCS